MKGYVQDIEGLSSVAGGELHQRAGGLAPEPWVVRHIARVVSRGEQE